MSEEVEFVHRETGQTRMATMEEFHNSLEAEGYRPIDQPDDVAEAPEAPAVSDRARGEEEVAVG